MRTAIWGVLMVLVGCTGGELAEAPDGGMEPGAEQEGSAGAGGDEGRDPEDIVNLIGLAGDGAQGGAGGAGGMDEPMAGASGGAGSGGGEAGSGGGEAGSGGGEAGSGGAGGMGGTGGMDEPVEPMGAGQCELCTSDEDCAEGFDCGGWLFDGSFDALVCLEVVGQFETCSGPELKRGAGNTAVCTPDPAITPDCARWLDAHGS